MDLSHLTLREVQEVQLRGTRCVVLIAVNRSWDMAMPEIRSRPWLYFPDV